MSQAEMLRIRLGEVERGENIAVRYKRSHLEDEFFGQIILNGLPKPTRELKFHACRRFRFDFAYEDRKLAIEIAGGIHTNGRHNRGTGFERDCEKYTQAALLGWRIFHFTSKSIKNCSAIRILKEELMGVYGQ